MKEQIQTGNTLWARLGSHQFPFGESPQWQNGGQFGHLEITFVQPVRNGEKLFVVDGVEFETSEMESADPADSLRVFQSGNWILEVLP